MIITIKSNILQSIYDSIFFIRIYTNIIWTFDLTVSAINKTMRQWSETEKHNWSERKFILKQKWGNCKFQSSDFFSVGGPHGCNISSKRLKRTLALVSFSLMANKFSWNKKTYHILFYSILIVSERLPNRNDRGQMHLCLCVGLSATQI